MRSALLFKVNQLGDNIVFLPVVQRLLAEQIFDRLTLWTTPLAAPLYQSLPPNFAIEVVAVEAFYPAWKNPSRLLPLVRRARRGHPEVTLVAEDMGNTAYFLGLASGASTRLGIRPPHLKIPFAINKEVVLPREAPAAEKSWQLGSALAKTGGGRPWSAQPPTPELSHLIQDDATAFDILIHAGASRDYQRWPLARYAELAKRLARDFRVGWIELPGLPKSSPAEVEIVHSLALSDLVSHLAKTSIFVCNNSGPMNVANALGTPSVVMMGPSSRSWDPYWYPERFRILRDESLPCIACDPSGLPIREVCTNGQHPMACMDHWTVEMVEAEVRGWHARRQTFHRKES